MRQSGGGVSPATGLALYSGTRPRPPPCDAPGASCITWC